MTTATIAQTKYAGLSSGVRTFGESTILTEGIEDMIKEVDADTLSLVERAKGGKYLHVKNSETGKYFTIRLGETVDARGKKSEDLIKDLVSNHVIYCGATENGVWYTFGKPGLVGDPIAEISLADFKKTKLKFYSGS